MPHLQLKNAVAVAGFALVVTAGGRAERPSVDAAAQASPTVTHLSTPSTRASSAAVAPLTALAPSAAPPAPASAPAIQSAPVLAEATLDDAIADVDQALADIDSALADTEDSR